MKDLQWVEKYRPATFEEVVGFPTVVKSIRSQLAKGKSNFPNLLLSGPAGIGKTSLARLIAQELLGEFYSVDYMELNASKDRGIDVIRDVIAKWTEFGSLGAGIKVMLLDECDEITSAAQQALRGVIEKHPYVKFILTCNEPKKVTLPIKSRCVQLKFDKPDREQVLSRLETIVASENIAITSPKDTLRKLITDCYPDIRTTIQSLQHLANDQPITKEKIIGLEMKLLQSTTSSLFSAVMDCSESGVLKHSKELVDSSGFSMIGTIRYFSYVLISMKKTYLIPILAYYDREMIKGASDEIQLLSMCLDLINARLRKKGQSSDVNWDNWRQEQERLIADGNDLTFW